MELEVKLFASLQRFNQQQERIEVEDGATVLDFLETFGIPPSEVAIVLVNGRHAELEQRLRNGESIAIFPPIAGG